ncbi:dCTP deaminase [Aureimonas sp. N4]|uniref:dCTP deaminase n=1 Tax=Aureimonas sp. N4 TaxID=1638165 RepID=UPI0007847C8B|nr:hypothetical protein [Aureimonas sp. N4]
MTVLSGPTIRKLQPVSPFIEAVKINGMTAGLSHCGYDIRIKDGFILQSGEFRIASTVERFDMPSDAMGVVHDKSTWARRGLSVFNTVIEPGWAGFLTLELVNNSFRPIQIASGSPIAQVIFHRLDEPVIGYVGKYQNQEDRPVAAILEGA